MSRVSLIEQLYVKRKSALEFNYDALWAPPIRSIFTQEDINELYRIATSLKYNGNIEKKYELIDSIMRSRGFIKAHSGTNRVVYNFLELPTFVAKVAVDRVGMKDSPAEFKNQNYFKPFCCKIFEVDPTGVIAFVERVNPITSLEEFLSVSDDIFNLMITKIIGKYVVDDLGVTKYMNYGLRYNANGYTFGPVIIDFPYAYELDGAKLICKKPIKLPDGTEVPCNGEIDYDDGLNGLFCTKCGREYKALDLQKHDKNVLVMYNDDKKGDNVKMRSRIVDKNGNVIMDSGFSSDTHITREEYESLPTFASASSDERRQVPVDRTYRKKYKSKYNIRRDAYTEFQTEVYNRMQNAGTFNTIGTAFNNADRPQKYKPSGIAGVVIPVEYEEVDEVEVTEPEVVTAAPADMLPESPSPAQWPLPYGIESSVYTEEPVADLVINEQPAEVIMPTAEQMVINDDTATESDEDDLTGAPNEEAEETATEKSDENPYDEDLGPYYELVRDAVMAIDALTSYNEVGNTVNFTAVVNGRVYNFEVEDGGPCGPDMPQYAESGVEINVNDIITDVNPSEKIDVEYEDPEAVMTSDSQNDDNKEEEEDIVDINDLVPAVNPNKQYRRNPKYQKHRNRGYDDDDYMDDMDEY